MADNRFASLRCSWGCLTATCSSFTHPDYPGERLVACRNPELGRARAHNRKRAALLEATRGELDQVCARVERGHLTGAGKIGVRVGRVLNKYKVAKHFELTIEAHRFDYRLLEESVAAEAALDGLYVIRTALAAQRMDAAEVVRGCRTQQGANPDAQSFQIVTTPNSTQRRVFELLRSITV